MFDYCVSRNKKGNGNNKESRVQCSIVEKCYPVIVLLALINGMDYHVHVLLCYYDKIQQNVTLLLCYCMLQRYLVTILLTLLYGMVLPCNSVTNVTISYCTAL